MEILAREREISFFQEVLKSGRPEFLVVYGRRRVGKTYLVKNFFQDQASFFHITGSPRQSARQQLWNFSQVYADVFNGGETITAPKTWQEAFGLLRGKIKSINGRQRIVLFFDELPWLVSKKSGFMQALSYLWNRYLESDPRIILIVCGSAASWMIKNIINAKGGLYNRVTRRLRLQPLDLHDAETYLRGRGVRLSRKQVIEIYMALGGIPAYLDNVKPGRSSAQVISDVCFDEQSPLSGEFERIFRSMFSHSELHTRVMRELLKRRSGIGRKELFAAAGIASGSVQNRVKQELLESGFIAESTVFGAKKKGALIRLIDPYVIFYLTWREKIPKSGTPVDPGYWRTLQNSSRWQAWAGCAFEGLCQSHVLQIARALGIHGIHYTCSAWRARPEKGRGAGAQVDLVIDRADRCINLCEVKFHDSEFTVTKSYAAQLDARKRTFAASTGTRKTVFTTMITCHGVKENRHYHDVVDNQLTMDALFERP